MSLLTDYKKKCIDLKENILYHRDLYHSLNSVKFCIKFSRVLLRSYFSLNLNYAFSSPLSNVPKDQLHYYADYDI